MVYEIPKIPTAEEISLLTNETKQSVQANLERVMLLEANAYQTWEQKRVEQQERFDAAYAKFQDDNKALIDELTEAKTEVALAREFLQGAAVARRQLTGDKTWKAFQAAEKLTSTYDHEAMLNWVLNEAPGQIRLSLLVLDKNATDLMIRTRADENGVPKPFEGAEAIPALVVKGYTGKILTKELEALVADKPSPETVPLQAVETFNQPVTVMTTPEQPSISYLLTKDEVEDRLARLATMTTPVEPTPVVEVPEEDKIPF